MVYRQNSDYLRYGEYPFSSYVYTYDPNNDVLKKEVEARGYYRFCRPHNHTAIEVIRILEGSVEIMLGGESFCATEGDAVFVSTTFSTILGSFSLPKKNIKNTQRPIRRIAAIGIRIHKARFIVFSPFFN